MPYFLLRRPGTTPYSPQRRFMTASGGVRRGHVPREIVLVVSGTRDGREDTFERLAWFCDTYGIPSRVILGDARGVDTQANEFFTSIGVPAQIMRANWWPIEGFNPVAGHDRNQAMIDAAPPEAHFLALPAWRSAGTWDCTRRAAQKFNKQQIHIFMPAALWVDT